MALVDLITEEIVKVPLESTGKAEVLRELVQVLKDAGRIEDYESALQAIQAREDKQSTGLERGIAVPHGKSGAVTKLTIAIGISREGIDFNSMDGEKSRLFFLLLAPPNQPGPHVEALAEIAKLAGSRTFCTTLMQARTAREVIELLEED